VAVLLYAAMMYWPLAADFFRLAPLDLAHWGVVLTASAVALLVCLALDRVFGRMKDEG
jgi:hypothetical protein